MRNLRKAVGDIRFNHPPSTPPGLIDEHLQGFVLPRFGRNPNEHGQKSASKIGSSTIFSAACTTRSRTAGIDNGRCSLGPGLRNQHPARRQRPIRPLPQFGGQLVEEPGQPRTPATSASVVLSMPGAPLLRRTVNPRPLQDVSAKDLVPQRVKPSPGIGLGRPVQRMLQGTNRIYKHGPRSGGTSRNGTHRAPPQQALRIDEAAALPSPAVVLSARLNQYYDRLRRPPGTATHFPGQPVIEHRTPATHSAGHRAGEGLSSSRRHYLNVPRPIRRRSSSAAALPGSSPPSMAFTLMAGGSALPVPPSRAGYI